LQPLQTVSPGYSCATLRYLTDPERDVTIPIGVILWNDDGSWHQIRLPGEAERIPDVAMAKAKPYLTDVTQP